MSSTTLKAPFPWFGGKSRVAHLVWERFGNVPNYVEPFFGSGAVLLGRPHAPKIETVNDLDCYVANFWRALKADSEAVEHWCDSPVNEADLTARHIWLTAQKEDLRLRCQGDPDYYDTKIAGWWVWGICAWIGSGWCSGGGCWGEEDGKLVKMSAGDGVEKKRFSAHEKGVSKRLPMLGKGPRGVHRKGVSRQLPIAKNQGVHCGRTEMLQQLGDRLRRVRVACGDWSRITGFCVTEDLGVTGVFLDPPYSSSADRKEVYSEDCFDVANDVRDWAVENGDNPMLRIALCGYEGEHAMPDSWDCVVWKAAGGYGSQSDGRGRKNAGRERIWFSPHCIQTELFPR